MHVGRKGGLYLDCLRRQLRWRTRHDTAARMVHSSDHAENVPLQLKLQVDVGFLEADWFVNAKQGGLMELATPRYMY
jgi:hypothetical protein